MTMMQKVQAKKSKKGFTLVELVIVIAILAILAAIAIPVITTTINSSKMSVLESDTATVNMLVKEAVNNRLAKIDTTEYAGVKATSDDLNVGNVLTANNLASDDAFFTRDIGGSDYKITAYGDAANGTLTVAVSGTKITDVPEGTAKDLAAGTTIKELAQLAGLEK